MAEQFRAMLGVRQPQDFVAIPFFDSACEGWIALLINGETLNGQPDH